MNVNCTLLFLLTYELLKENCTKRVISIYSENHSCSLPNTHSSIKRAQSTDYCFGPSLREDNSVMVSYFPLLTSWMRVGDRGWSRCMRTLCYA